MPPSAVNEITNGFTSSVIILGITNVVRHNSSVYSYLGKGGVFCLYPKGPCMEIQMEFLFSLISVFVSSSCAYRVGLGWVVGYFESLHVSSFVYNKVGV